MYLICQEFADFCKIPNQKWNKTKYNTDPVFKKLSTFSSSFSNTYFVWKLLQKQKTGTIKYLKKLIHIKIERKYTIMLFSIFERTGQPHKFKLNNSFPLSSIKL